MTTITRKRGDTYPDVFLVKAEATELPVDITGCTFLLTLDPFRYPEDSSGNLYQLTGNVVDPAAGRVEFAPTEEQANQVGKWYFDMEMTDGAGRKRTIDSGRYIYKQDITK